MDPEGKAGDAWVSEQARGHGPVDTRPGWTHELPFGHGLAPGDDAIHARVSLVIYQREHAVEAHLVAVSSSSP